MLHHLITFLLGAAAPCLKCVNITANSIGVPTTTSTLDVGLTNGIKLMMSIIGGLAVIFLIVGGIQMIISTGNASRISRARETITYAIVGLVVAIAAYAIVSFVATTFK